MANEFGIDDGVTYAVSELVEGATLREILPHDQANVLVRNSVRNE
jgi:hypothetical protein